MKKLKHPGVLYLILSFLVLLIVSVSFFSYVFIKNGKKSTYSGHVNQNNGDFILKLEIPEDKRWVNDEGTPNQNYGEQFNFWVDANNGAELTNWKLTISFTDDIFELIKIDSSWNVDLETLTSSVKEISVTAEKGLTIETLKQKETNKFGFILLVKNKITEENFENFQYTLTGEFHKELISYPLLWVLIFLYFVYLGLFIAYVVVRLKERNFEKFKENSYSIISQSMNAFASLIDVKDPYTKDHSARVSFYSVKIARKLNLSDEEVRNIAYIALMHDCGKLVIEDDILSKPDKLTPEEYEEMKTHTTHGGKALENITSIKGIKDGAMYHHEHYDGSGYPKGLKGEEIPLYARIIGVADALDAMSSDRCYRKKLPKDKIIEELKSCSGSQFDPKIASIVIDMINNNEINIYE